MSVFIRSRLYGLSVPMTAKDLKPQAVSECAACSAFKNRQQMKGKIISSEDNEPAVGATIYNHSTKKGVITDVNGVYSIEASPDDIIEIRYNGAQTVKNQAKSIPQVLVLNVSVHELEGTTVVATPRLVVTKSHNRQVNNSKGWLWTGLFVLGAITVYHFTKPKAKTVNM